MTPPQFAKLAGISRMHACRIAPHLPGATRQRPRATWRIPNTPEIHEWAKRWRLKEKPKSPPKPERINLEELLGRPDFNENGPVFAPRTTQEKWSEVHRAILLCKGKPRSFKTRSRKFAVQKWGIKFTAQNELKLEIELGMFRNKKPSLNPPDKSRAFVTIEGISMQFDLWTKKTKELIPDWGDDQIIRALSLIAPAAVAFRELMDRLSPQKRVVALWEIAADNKQLNLSALR